MNAILAKLLGAKGGWKFVLDFLILMVQAQKLKIPGTEKLNEVIDKSGIAKITERLISKSKTSQLYPLAVGNFMIAAMNIAANVDFAEFLIV